MAEPGPAGSSRTEETRTRLLEAALDVFGERGFDGASTRMLADRAGVNLSAIPYYFGGKQGLYLAVASFIAQKIRVRLGPAIDTARQDLERPETDDEDKLIAVLQGLLHPFAAMIILDAGRWSGFIMREQMHPTAAFQILFEQAMGEFQGTVSAVVGRLLERSPRDDETLITSITIIGQILAFRTSRAAVLRTLDCETLTEQHLSSIQDIVDRNVDAILRSATGPRS